MVRLCGGLRFSRVNAVGFASIVLDKIAGRFIAIMQQEAHLFEAELYMGSNSTAGPSSVAW
jgi:hypothetical protein